MEGWAAATHSHRMDTRNHFCLSVTPSRPAREPLLCSRAHSNWPDPQARYQARAPPGNCVLRGRPRRAGPDKHVCSTEYSPGCQRAKLLNPMWAAPGPAGLVSLF